LPSPIRDAQDRASTAAIEDQVRLLDQVTDIGTGVMAGHGMMSVAEEGFSIFGRHAGRTQTTPKGVPQVVDTDARQANFSASKLPCGVVHGPNPSAAIREHPDRIDPDLWRPTAEFFRSENPS